MALLTEWKTLEYRPNWGPSVAWSPDSRVLACGSGEHTIRLWDVATGQPIQTFTGPYCYSYFLVYSPDGITLASGDEEFDPAVVRLWDVPSGRLRLTLPGQADFITDLAFSPDGTLLASAGDGVRVWDTRTGIQVWKFNAGGPVAFSPDGRYLASVVHMPSQPGQGGKYDDTIGIWDLAHGGEGHILAGEYASIGRLVYSPDGSTILSAGNPPGKAVARNALITVWDVAAGQAAHHIQREYNVSAIAWSPRGKLWAMAESRQRWFKGDPTGYITCWEPATREILETVPADSRGVADLTFSPSGEFLAGAGTGLIKIWTVDR